MIYVGGRRSRLVRDNFYSMLRTAVEDLGWMDSGRQHKPVTFSFDPVNYQEELKPNAIVISDGDIRESEEELGSDLTEHRWVYFVDVYAESSAVGIDLSNDIRSALAGRMPSIGRTSPSFPVYDLSQATPTQLFVCQLENISMGRGQVFSKPWERFWYSVFVDVIDIYGNENDS